MKPDRCNLAFRCRTRSPKERGVDLIRYNCLHSESRQWNPISSILEETLASPPLSSALLRHMVVLYH